ncbi:efflux transporter outer membrane subunit [Rhodobacter sp. Har01]|uniref:efflux transporter outer membrane subunit n=1 Tax=Rhodobacter sp. Har01 TaxID=2883999 RepID=UPI001D06C39C|nr:efflux transporter outer membrane subunit [Rhodobacter sp. Har01]MCB6180241.1 efflux transporter outer membrane subunit [Rhodobacter sp. Har01]
MSDGTRRGLFRGLLSSARLGVRPWVGLWVVVGLVAGCAADPGYRAPAFPFLNGYSTVRSGAPVLMENVAWWRGFSDPGLDALVERALAGNLSLALARERVSQAEAQRDTLAGGGSASAEGRYGRRRAAGSLGAVEGRNEAEVTLGLQWLFDPWGARARQAEAADARIDAADAEVDAARLLILYNLANAYVDLCYQRRVLQLLRQQQASRNQTLDLTRTLVEQDAATRLDLVRAEALVAETLARIPPVEAEIRALRNQIAVLTGAMPGAMADLAGGSAGQPVPKLAPDPGIPTDLLRNRPDIRIAERLYYAAVAETGAAEADLYPRLSLGGTISGAVIAGKGGADSYFGPSLVLPALPQGPRRAIVEVRRSQARQAHLSWQSTVLGAIAEVETALAQYAGSRAGVAAARRTVQLYREAAELTRDLVRREGATIGELIDAEESIADADLTLAENLRQLGRSYVALNVALGSGNSHNTHPIPKDPKAEN